MKKVAILFIVLLASSFVFAQKTYVPDDKFEQALIDLGYDTTLDDSVLTANISDVTSLDVMGKEISDLTGIEAFTALIVLECDNNQLTSLDMSKNIALKELHCPGNQLTSLNVSKNTALEILNCERNQLTYLNMRNGVTDKLNEFYASNNSSLTCIETLDPDYATANWISSNGNIDIDAGVTFAVICGAEAVTKWHVATTGSDASGSGTLASPLATIQTGINAATDSDTVLVAAGTYKENIKLNFIDISIIGKNRETTIIDGDQKGTVVKFHRYHNHNKTVLSGFTITNGKGTVDEGGPWGGGIEINGAGVKIKPLLRDLIIENNTALNGAGIRLYNSASPNIENCIIRNNQAIYPDPSGKWAAGTGGGISADGYEGTMKNVLFAENSSLSGGALSVFNGNTTLPVNIVNCTFVNNYSFENSDIFLDGASTLHVTNTIIWDDILISQLNGTVTLNVDNSLIQGGYSGEGNLDVNPFFVNVDTTGGIKGDYHLKDWSPAIGAGTATGAPTTDIEGNPRPNPAGSNPDMGAFENKWGTPQNAPPVLTALSDVSVNEDKSYSDTLRATDEEGDAITYSAASDTSAVTASISDSILTLTPNANWHGVANIKAYASDGTSKDSTSFKLTVTPVQDAPTGFDWVSSALDTINITKSNLADAYTLQWDASTDVDGETINYLIYAKIGLYLTEEVEEITDTTFQLIYEEILEHVFEGQPINAATVRFSIKATDGIDTVDVTGDDRVLFVNRYEYLSTVGEGVPVEFALHENYPNPFNPTTTLRFDLPEVSNLTLTIYNMLGQKVRTFNMQSTPAGYHSVKWNATNDYGDPVGAGVYLYQLQTKDFVKTRKMVLLK